MVSFSSMFTIPTRGEVTMLHARELADRIDLTNGVKTCIFNPDGSYG